MTTTAQLACSSLRANGPLMARKINDYPYKIKAQVQDRVLAWAFGVGAGDENRTRTISLGS